MAGVTLHNPLSRLNQTSLETPCISARCPAYNSFPLTSGGSSYIGLEAASADTITCRGCPSSACTALKFIPTGTSNCGLPSGPSTTNRFAVPAPPSTSTGTMTGAAGGVFFSSFGSSGGSPPGRSSTSSVGSDSGAIGVARDLPMRRRWISTQDLTARRAWKRLCRLCSG